LHSTNDQGAKVTPTERSAQKPSRKTGLFATLSNLCWPISDRSKLVMPTTLVGQNGAVIHQGTKISVTDCPKARKVKRRKVKK